jgi:hypothetical protein
MAKAKRSHVFAWPPRRAAMPLKNSKNLLRSNMNIAFLRGKKELAPAVLLGVAVIVALAGLIRITVFAAGPWSGAAALAEQVDRNQSQSDVLEKHLAANKKTADELKTKNPFVMVSKAKPQTPKVNGVLGDKVLINGAWYGVGQTVGGAKILAIEAARVMVEWEGKTIPLEIVAAPSSGGGPAKPPAPVMAKAEPPKPAAPPPAAPAAAPAVEDPLAWMGITLSPTAYARFLEMWNKMDDTQKAKAKEEWAKMPEDQKQQIVQKMNAQH